MNFRSVALCVVSGWFSVKINYTEIHREDTEIHGVKGKQAPFVNYSGLEGYTLLYHFRQKMHRKPVSDEDKQYRKESH